MVIQDNYSEIEKSKSPLYYPTLFFIFLIKNVFNFKRQFEQELRPLLKRVTGLYFIFEICMKIT